MATKAPTLKPKRMGRGETPPHNPGLMEMKMPETVQDHKGRLLTRLYWWREDIEKIMQILEKDGLEFTNLELMRKHMKEYEKICDEIASV